MEISTLLMAVIGFTGYLVISYGILYRNVEQNFTTWILWACLDAVAAFASFREAGEYILPSVYAIGSIVVSIILLCKGQVAWDKDDWKIALLVLVCVGVWQTQGNIAGIIASVTALLIAPIQQIKATYRKPETTPALPYIFFWIASMISIFSNTDWSIKEKLYPATAASLCGIIIWFASRKTQFKSSNA